MTDILSPEARSINMATIHGKNTSIEQFICHELFHRGYRYRKDVNYIPGHPDIFLRKYNTAIFVHGCFWHRHENCKYAYMPKSNIDFWIKKFNANVSRDRIIKKELKTDGIKMLIIWECTIRRMKKDPQLCKKMIDKTERFLQSDNLFDEY